MYSSWFPQEVHLLSGHPAIAAAIILFLAGSESAPVIGALIPGTVTIIAIAAGVSTSAWTAGLVTIAGALGAILGDCLSFTFGRFHSAWVQERTKSGRFAAMLDRSNQFFARHGGKSVFLARFLPGVRAVVPLVAGATRMAPRSFYPPSIASALAWASSHILPPALLGASVAAGQAKIAIAIALAIAVALFATHRLRRLLHSRKANQPAG